MINKPKITFLLSILMITMHTNTTEFKETATWIG
jgi:hypothetical protein